MADERRQRFRHGNGPEAGEPALAAGPDSQGRDEVGRILRRAREAAGIDLDDLAETLRIRRDYLHAIERSDFDSLPGATYAAGFVRSYANYLDLDAEEILRRFKAEAAGLARGQTLHFPEPVNEGKVPGAAILLISLVLAAVVYGGWYALTSRGQSMSDLVPPVPERLQELVGVGDPDTASDGASDRGSDGRVGVSDFASDSNAVREEAPRQRAEAPEAAEDVTPSEAAPDPEADPEAAPEVAREPAPEIATASDAPELGVPESNGPESNGPATVSSETGVTDSGNGTATPEAPPAEAPDVEVAAPDVAPEERAGGAQTAIPAAPSPDPDPVADARDTAMRPDSDAASSGRTSPPPAAAANGGTAPDAAPDAAPETAAEDAASAATEERAAQTQEDAVRGARNQGARNQGAGNQGAEQEDASSEGASEGAGSGGAGLAGAVEVFGAENAGSRVTLRAAEDSWVQVRDGAGNILLTRILRPDQAYRVPAGEGAILHTGNAGGLRVYLDGQPLRRLGETGEVRRGVALDPTALR